MTLACLICDIKDIYFWVPRGGGGMGGGGGANLVYLAHPLPGELFKDAKSFIGTQEMQIIFVVKDKLFCSMKCMVSMAIINMILAHGVYIHDWSYSHCYSS